MYVIVHYVDTYLHIFHSKMAHYKTYYTAIGMYAVKKCSFLPTYEESSRTQILNVNRPSTTKPRPQVKQDRLPTKTAVPVGLSY